MGWIGVSTTERSTAESIRSRGTASTARPDPRRRRALVAALIALCAALSLGVGGVAPASAAGFAITSHADGDFVSGRTVTLAGVGTEGARVAVTGSGIAGCSTEVRAGTWSCALELPDGATVLTATQSGDASSRPAPPAPDAEPEPSLAPVPGSETATITLRVLGAPAITGADPLATSGLVSGTAFPNAGIRLRSGDRTIDCPTAGPDGVWTCAVTGAPDGAAATSVQQFVPGSPAESSPWSAPRTVVLDTGIPASPAITSPAPGARLTGGTVQFTGTGESGASLDVFATGQLLCRVTVVDGSWSCAATPPTGDQVVQAVQRDAAGNYSAPSTVLRLVFGATAPRSPSPSAQAPAPAPEGSVPAPAPVDPAPSSPTEPDRGMPPGSRGTGWSAPTGFGAALATPAAGSPLDQGLIGLLVAGAFILLVALPLRLALPLLAARLHWRAPRVFGRNLARGADGRTPPSPADEPAVAPAWPRLVAVVLGATLLIAFAIGIESEARYARLVLAIAVGVAVVNVVGAGVATLIAGRATRTPVRWRIVGPFLLAAVVATLVSRMLSIEPPLVVGVVVVGLAVAALGTRRAAVVALAQLGAIAALATAAWLAHPLIVGVGGFWGAALGETLAAICVAGFGSLPLLLLPIGTLPGRAVFEWSTPVWAGCSVVAVTVAAGALAVSGGSLAAIGLVGLGVGAASMGAWAWVRWVEPALAARG